jgi:GNAT superfamily N-acetyltransferase
MTTQRADLPPRLVQLKDRRIVRVRHGRVGDEAGIARLLAAAFPVYLRAARGDPERAVRCLARELEPEAYVVAVLADGDPLVGVACVSSRGRTLSRVERVRRKLACWGAYGLLCFLLEKVRSRLLESRFRARPGELYRYLDAVDATCRSLGVGRHIADFVEDYARAAGHDTVSAKHRSDNRPVLALHRKRGCVLVELPPTPLARLLRRRGMVVSSRALSAPASPPAALGTAAAR